MKKINPLKGETLLGLLFTSCFFVSFAGGCSAKLLYQTMNDNPVWLNTVVVAMFQGLFFFSWGIIGLLASRKFYKQPNSLTSKARAVLIFIFFCIPPLFFGLSDLRAAITNLISLL